MEKPKTKVRRLRRAIFASAAGTNVEVTPAPSSEDTIPQRILDAIKELKPQKKFWLFALINSAFFLWLLTALFVTTGGTYISKRLECMKDAQDAVDRYNLLYDELGSRRWKTVDIIGNNDMSQALTLVRAIPADSDTFKGVTTMSLIRQFESIDKLIDGYHSRRIAEYGRLSVFRIFNGDTYDFSEKEYQRVKKDSLEALDNDDDFVTVSISPNCNISTIWHRYVSGEQTPILVATASPIPVPTPDELRIDRSDAYPYNPSH
jgi:hypothetical protein